jgi:hypothetical protein
MTVPHGHITLSGRICFWPRPKRFRNRAAKRTTVLLSLGWLDVTRNPKPPKKMRHQVCPAWRYEWILCSPQFPGFQLDHLRAEIPTGIEPTWISPGKWWLGDFKSALHPRRPGEVTVEYYPVAEADSPVDVPIFCRWFGSCLFKKQSWYSWWRLSSKWSGWPQTEPIDPRKKFTQ